MRPSHHPSFNNPHLWLKTIAMDSLLPGKLNRQLLQLPHRHLSRTIAQSSLHCRLYHHHVLSQTTTVPVILGATVRCWLCSPRLMNNQMMRMSAKPMLCSVRHQPCRWQLQSNRVLLQLSDMVTMALRYVHQHVLGSESSITAPVCRSLVKINQSFKVTTAGTVHQGHQPFTAPRLLHAAHVESNHHILMLTHPPGHLNHIRRYGKKLLAMQNVLSVHMSLVSVDSQTLYLVSERQESVWRMLSRCIKRKVARLNLVSTNRAIHYLI